MNYNLKSIGRNAFIGCKLKHIEIPNSLEVLGGGVFSQCNLLREVVISKNHPKFHFEDYILIDKIEGAVHTYFSCNRDSTFLASNHIKKISPYAFSNCDHLEEIILGRVSLISEFAFLGCKKLKSITLSDSLNVIEKGAFSGCQCLRQIVIPEGIESFESEIFDGCVQLEEVNIPDSLKQIKSDCFRKCKNLHKIRINESHRIFSFDSEFLIDNTKNALIFYVNGKKENCIIPKEIRHISKYAFYQNSYFKILTGTDSLIVIDAYAFYYCSSLKELGSLSSLKYIGDNAFTGCMELIELNLPRSVNFIGKNTFYNCKKLTLHVFKDSYAHKYAQENSINFLLNNEDKNV